MVENDNKFVFNYNDDERNGLNINLVEKIK